MGLDIVEIFLRAEETFAIAIPDGEAGQAQTVGDLYRLILDKLALPYHPASEIESLNQDVPPGRDRSRTGPATEWTTPDVWITLKALIVDQLQVDAGEITEAANFQKDLGAD
jgi:acyl carrier protein